MDQTESATARTLGTLGEPFLEKASAILADYGLDDGFEQKVCGWLEERIVAHYRDIFESALPRSSVGLDLQNVALKLRISRGTKSKWLAEDPEKKVEPSWDSIFLALAAFDIDLGVRPIPRGRVAVNYGVRETVSLIRADTFRVSCACITQVELEYIHLACTFEKWHRALKLQDPVLLKKAAKEMGTLVQWQIGENPDWGCTKIMKVGEDWSEAWCLFQATIPYTDWTF